MEWVEPLNSIDPSISYLDYTDLISQIFFLLSIQCRCDLLQIKSLTVANFLHVRLLLPQKQQKSNLSAVIFSWLILVAEVVDSSRSILSRKIENILGNIHVSRLIWAGSYSLLLNVLFIRQ